MPLLGMNRSRREHYNQGNETLISQECTDPTGQYITRLFYSIYFVCICIGLGGEEGGSPNSHVSMPLTGSSIGMLVQYIVDTIQRRRVEISCK